MIKTGMLATILLLCGTALANAQQLPPPPFAMKDGGMQPPGAGGMHDGMPGMGHMGMHGMDRGMGHMGMHGMGMNHMPEMMDQGAGFSLMLGRGVSIRVNCGNDPIKTCVDAALPLLDKASGMLDKLPKPPPPAAPPAP